MYLLKVESIVYSYGIFKYTPWVTPLINQNVYDCHEHLVLRAVLCGVLPRPLMGP